MDRILKNVYIYIKDFEKYRTVKLEGLKTFYINNESELDLSNENSILLTDDEKIINKYKLPFVFYLHENNKNASLPSGAYCIEGIEDIDSQYLIRVFQRYYDIPWRILETDRLIIEEISIEDVYRLKQLYEDPDITRYMENLFPLEEEIEYTKGYIKNVYAFYGYGMWLMKLKDSMTIIGRVGVEYKEGFDGLELGFMLGKDYWNKGYAYESCKAVIEYSKNDLYINSFRAMVHKDNASSKKLCEKLGFKKYGIKDDFIDYRLMEGKI